MGAVSFIICQGQKQPSRVPESQWARAARTIHPGTAVRSPDPQGAAVVSQQQTKEPPPQNSPLVPHLLSLWGRTSLGASVPKGAPVGGPPGCGSVRSGGLAGSPSDRGCGQSGLEAARAGACLHLPRSPGQSAGFPLLRGGHKCLGQGHACRCRPRPSLYVSGTHLGIFCKSPHSTLTVSKLGTTQSRTKRKEMLHPSGLWVLPGTSLQLPSPHGLQWGALQLEQGGGVALWSPWAAPSS